jgi:hypothetical protein
MLLEEQLMDKNDYFLNVVKELWPDWEWEFKDLGYALAVECSECRFVIDVFSEVAAIGITRRKAGIASMVQGDLSDHEDVKAAIASMVQGDLSDHEDVKAAFIKAFNSPKDWLKT